MRRIFLIHSQRPCVTSIFSQLREQVVELNKERETLRENNANTSTLKERVRKLQVELAAVDQCPTKEALASLEQEEVQ